MYPEGLAGLSGPRSEALLDTLTGIVNPPFPPPARQQVLQELHGGHLGISRMKSLAHMFVWWPEIDGEIEQMVKHCSVCQQDREAQLVPMQPWQWPTRPWARLHLDYAGPFMGHMFLLIIDAHSKWIEAYMMPTATSTATIQELRATFAQFGIPETVVTDNGSCFTSEEFKMFLHKNGITHFKSAPYHPATNGLVERAVKIVKKGLKKMKDGTLTDKLSRVLLTPQKTTGISPAELLMGRLLRSGSASSKYH